MQSSGLPYGINKGQADESASFVDEAGDVSAGTATDAEDTDETFSDHPPFSPEGMIDWLFERCHRRHMRAVSLGDQVKENA